MILSEKPAVINGFPSELDDREWLAARSKALGDETVAAELRVSQKAVRRARERFGIEGPVEPHPVEPQHAARLSTNGSSANGNNGVNGVSANGTNGSRADRANGSRADFVSDEELTQRISRVKKGLADTCARLVTAINELEVVRQQVAPPEQTPSRPHA